MRAESRLPVRQMSSRSLLVMDAMTSSRESVLPGMSGRLKLGLHRMEKLPPPSPFHRLLVTYELARRESHVNHGK